MVSMSFPLMLNFFMVAHSSSCHTLSKAFLKSMDTWQIFLWCSRCFETGFLGWIYVLLCFCHDGNLHVLRQWCFPYGVSVYSKWSSTQLCCRSWSRWWCGSYWTFESCLSWVWWWWSILSMLKATYPCPTFGCTWRGELRPLVVRRVLSVRRAHYQLELPFRILMFWWPIPLLIWGLGILLPPLVLDRLVHLCRLCSEKSTQLWAVLCPSFRCVFSFGKAFPILVLDVIDFALLLFSEDFHTLKGFLCIVGSDWIFDLFTLAIDPFLLGLLHSFLYLFVHFSVL